MNTFNKFIALAMFTVGCDSPSILANIDTYTCAYLPGVIDCTTQEVHDKAVSVLQNGLVAGEVRCEGAALSHGRMNADPAIPGGGVIVPSASTYVTFKYRAQKLQEGTCFVNWSAGGAFDAGFIPRSSAEAEGCAVEIADGVTLRSTATGALASSVNLSVYPVFQSGSTNLIPIATPDTEFLNCAGVNLEVF